MSTRVSTLTDGTYTDPGQTGLQLRVRAKQDGRSTRTWLLRFKFKGEETRMVLGHFPQTTLDAARGLAREAREQAAKGMDPRRASPRRRAKRSPLAVSAAHVGSQHTIEFLASEFLERHVKVNHKQPEYTQRILNLDVLSEWKGRDARSIKPREVIELLDGIVGRGSAVMANRTAGVLGQMFKFGVHRALIDSSPVQLLYRPGGKESSRERCLTDAELKALLADPREATRFDRLAHVIVILLLTGQRRGELALARWSDIDFDAKTWHIPPENAKTGKSHTVPLSDWAAREFEALRRLAKRSTYVLPNDAGDGPADAKLLTRGLARCQARMQKLGIAKFTLHDLRRTCRTGLAKLGVVPHIAERVLNHAQEKITGTYDTHGYLDEKRTALTKWGAHLTDLVR
ncbi:MAG: tyrosine-type recombinase/integrase [Pseudomonadota bacterium]|nr:tyrosine-type recombinase/integrase [Pseudomonadota bacterium]